MNTELSGAASREHPSAQGPTGAPKCYSKLPEEKHKQVTQPFVEPSGQNHRLPSLCFPLQTARCKARGRGGGRGGGVGALPPDGLAPRRNKACHSLRACVGKTVFHRPVLSPASGVGKVKEIVSS